MHRQQIFQKLHDPMHLQIIQCIYSHFFKRWMTPCIYNKFFQMLNDSIHLQLIFMFFSFKSWVVQCIYNLVFINGSTHLRTTLSNANWFNASTTNFVFSNKWLNASTLLFFQMLSPPIYLIIQSCIDLLIYLLIWFV